jgi:hypothetical protein
MYTINSFMLSFRSYLREMFDKPENIPDIHPDMIVPFDEPNPREYLSNKWKTKSGIFYVHNFVNPYTGRAHKIETTIDGVFPDGKGGKDAHVAFSVDDHYTNYNNRISDLNVAAHIAKTVHGHVAHYAHHTGITGLRFSVVDHEQNKEKRSDLYGKLARSLGLKAKRYITDSDGQGKYKELF